MISMDAPSSLPPGGHSAPSDKPPPGAADPWRILLIELVHLLALFFTHARHAQRARATAVMFGQIVRRLDTLDRMPGHDGGMIIRRIGHSSTTAISKPDYFFLFGDLAFRGGEALNRDSASYQRLSHLARSLEQAFACFHDQGVYALYLQIPPKSPEKIDQLQLALNIVARFRQAVENNASITFRYFGHVLAIPLIRDTSGRPDPNLTLLAGLNGLSAVNMRKLIKQADAFHQLSPAGDAAGRMKGAYDSIFRSRSLRSQLIKPLVEINNLPWIPMGEVVRGTVAHEESVSSTPLAHPVAVQDPASPASPSQAPNIQDPLGLTLSPQYLSLYLDTAEPAVTRAVEALFHQDYGDLDAEGLGKRLGALSRLLHALGDQSGDPLLMERVLCFLHGRLEQLPDALVDHLEVQRQGLKIRGQGGAILVGMVHSRVLDLIALIKERMLTRKKMAVVDAWASDFERCDFEALAESFNLSAADCAAIVKFLEIFPDSAGQFDPARLEHHIGTFSTFGNSAFELLWCFLRRTPRHQDRPALLNVLARLIMRLQDRKRPMSFLLSDLLQAPLQLQVDERHVFTLANYMLHAGKKEDYFNSDGTPEEVLTARQGLNERFKRHTAWRLDIDQVRVLSKFGSIREKLRDNIQEPFAAASNSPLGLASLLSMEREGLIMMALAEGETAREVLRGALALYGEPDSEIYLYRMNTHHLAELMDHLRLVLKAMAILGRPQDLERLKALEQSASRLMALDTDNAHRRRVKQALQWAAPAIRAIQVQL